MRPRPTSCDAHSDARSLTLSAPSLFSSGLRIGTVRLFSTMSTVLAIPVDATAPAANGPPPAMSQVVISMYSVCRPDSLTLPVTRRRRSRATARRGAGGVGAPPGAPPPPPPAAVADQGGQPHRRLVAAQQADRVQRPGV